MLTAFRVLALCALGVGVCLAAPPEPAAAPKPSSFDLQRESLKKQRESIKAQLGPDIQPFDVDFGFLTARTPPPPLQQADCPPLEQDKVDALISAAAKKQSLSADLIRAVMAQESAFKPCAVSYKGAQGLMQLMPETASQLNVSDPFDPEQNVHAGSAYLKQLMDKYKNDVKLVLAAYNAGTTVADQGSASFPQVTQDYIAAVLASLQKQERTAAK